MAPKREDYDSPWKDAVEQHFPEFVAFYFPQAHREIDWSKGYQFLDQELQAVVRDAELGRRYVDKLALVTLHSGEQKRIYVHVEVQGRPEDAFSERVFVYNYRLYDRYRQPVASLVVLADDSPHWRPDGFGYAAFGCRMSFAFPVVKLLDYAGREAELMADANPFAVVTAASLMARATRKDMTARFDAKWALVRSLYQRGWDRQRIIDLFAILDWMMRLPKELSDKLYANVQELEEHGKMRYVTSVERIGYRRGYDQGWDEGLKEGEAKALIRLLERRFGPLSADRCEVILAAEAEAVEAWLDRVMDASSVEIIFADRAVH